MNEQTDTPQPDAAAMPEMGDGAVGQTADADTPTDPGLQPRATMQDHAPEDYSSVPQQKPSIGRIVHYLAKDEGIAKPVLRDGKIYPATIIEVHGDDCVDLTVFGEAATLHSRTSALYGHQWAWPPRV